MVSWLPLYHDMGLVGLPDDADDAPARDLVQAAPQDFLAHPGNWMEWISTYGGTATAGPNFSWVLATRALRRMSGLDLSSLRIALNGAEPVDPDAVEAFVAAAAPLRVPAGRGVLARSAWPRWRSPARSRRRCGAWCCDAVDRRRARAERMRRSPSTREPTTARAGCRCSASPVPGLEIRIVDPNTGEVAPRARRSASSRSAARR